MMGLEGIQLLPNHQRFVERFIKACESDDRVVAAFVGGSYAKGKSDQFSDIDLTVIATDDSLEEFYNQREAFLRSLGELVFLENFDNPNIAFYIFADGTEGELYFVSESHFDRIHSGPFRVLVDKQGILTNAIFPDPEADSADQRDKLRQNIYLFWHEMSHFTTAIARGKLWWARGQLDQLRSICVNLARLQNNFLDGEVGEEPYFKIEYVMPVDKLSPLEETFCPMDKNTMLQSAQVIVRFYKEVAGSLAQTHQIPYPERLQNTMLEKLKRVSQ